LYLKSAIAGMDSHFEGECRMVSTIVSMLKYGSCAIVCRESCQVGNQAALSEVGNVPQGSLYGVVDDGMRIGHIIR